MQSGDILVSKSLATIDYHISVVPNPPHLTCRKHDVAVMKGRALAKRFRVNAWLTEDRTHWIHLLPCRVDDAGPSSWNDNET